MEPRARAGKNVGKASFKEPEIIQLLYSHGDVKNPLEETVKVLDEIVTDFIQGVAFEATRAAHHAGRQKVKFEDFEFALRRSPRFMGKIQDTFEKKKEIENMRKGFNIEDQLMKDVDRDEKAAERIEARGLKRSRQMVGEEELEDDDLDLEGDGEPPKKK